MNFGIFYHVINRGCWFTQGIVNLYITTVQTFIEQYVCVLFVFEQLGLMSSTLNANVLDPKIGLKLETIEQIEAFVALFQCFQYFLHSLTKLNDFLGAIGCVMYWGMSDSTLVLVWLLNSNDQKNAFWNVRSMI